jgi:DNA polymerase III epsilon subunit-like protein
MIVLDTETTGLPRHPFARVVELAAVRLVDGVEVANFSSFVRTSPENCARGAEALAVNQIDPAQLADAPTPEEVAAAFTAWVDGEVVTSFNVAFDRSMIERTFPGLSLSWGPCVMERALEVMGPANVLPRLRDGSRWKRPSLREAAAFFEVAAQEPAHRALADARTAAGVWRALCAR